MTTPPCVILAGGRGTRISEESHLRPKPMIEIGGRPILWHIMKYYAHFGVNEFIVCLGYRGYMVKEYFFNYYLHNSDATLDLASNTAEFHTSRSEPWRVTLVDTGEATSTGGRLRRIRQYLDPEKPFFMTYGDGLADVEIDAELEFHLGHGRLATMTVVEPPARFGRSVLEGDRVIEFGEKAHGPGASINGGFFVLSPAALDLVEGDETTWEYEPMRRLVALDQLRAWRHEGFWQPMDTLREKERLEALWHGEKAPWKRWE
jgi:glucose-1-phosphate cytidylyltransferase